MTWSIMFYFYSYDYVYIYLVATNTYVNLSSTTIGGQENAKTIKNYHCHSRIISDI